MAKFGKFATQLLLFFTCMFLFVGCGGSGGSSGSTLPPLPTFSPGSITPTERREAINEVIAFFDTVKASPTRRTEILNKLKTMPIFLVSEISASGDVVGWFRDGRCLFVATSLDRDFESTDSASRAPKRPDAGDGLSHGKKAVLINSFEPARQDAIAEIAPKLSEKGYEVQFLTGTVEDYKNLRDLSLLFVHAHGILSTDQSRKMKFWYVTTTAPTDALDVTYLPYLNNNQISYTTAEVFDKDGNSEVRDFYAINTDFIRDSGVNFKPNATWMSQSCSSMNADVLSLSKQLGVSNYIGWTKPQKTSQSTPTTGRLFDLLLGGNQYSPAGVIREPQTVKEAMSLLKDTMREGGELNFIQSSVGETVSTLVADVGNESAKTIVPSVRSANVNVAQQQLSIEGFFGPQAGAGPVTLNGDILNVLSWTETKIVADLPVANQGVLLVRSIGAASASGYLFSNSFAYSAIGLKIDPNTANVGYNENKTFNALIESGVAPAGARYRWTVTGDGRVNGAKTVTLTSTTVTYRSSNSDGSDTLKLELLNASNVVVAQTSVPILVGNSPRINFVIAGAWDPEKTPSNGTYSYSGGQGARFEPEPGTEALAFAYNIGEIEETVGVLLTLVVEPGAPISAPRTFVLGQTGQALTPGKFILTLATNQEDPDDPKSTQHKVGTSGTLTVLSITSLPNNQKRVSYSFSISNDGTGTVTGTGVQLYTGP